MQPGIQRSLRVWIQSSTPSQSQLNCNDERGEMRQTDQSGERGKQFLRRKFMLNFIEANTFCVCTMLHATWVANVVSNLGRGAKNRDAHWKRSSLVIRRTGLATSRYENSRTKTMLGRGGVKNLQINFIGRFCKKSKWSSPRLTSFLIHSIEAKYLP